jgi:hypothetical protein
VLKLGRTIADLAGAGEIGPAHVSEAIQYGSLDRHPASYLMLLQQKYTPDAGA